ncbi:Uncharacterized N-terminal domain of lipid-A-disaccharide synthase [Luteibacter sp. UNCMF366Tsu5.1]|nr:Uncharacterized N-terminal domain of lipid-A-disaccharide synthase [Luteibacter sp. UNCMF366Tsu5.1]
MSFLQNRLESVTPWLYADSSAWTAIGLFGTALFGSRFVVQWICSERSGRVVVPPVFWHLSFWGSLISLLYALHLDKLPIILGQALLPVLHGRNLWLLRKR